MLIPNIKNMTPEKIMRKPVFKRLLPPDNLPANGNGRRVYTPGADYTFGERTGRYEVVTPLDCMQEYDMNAHKILSKSYYPNPVSKDENGNYYERQLARVTVDLIQMFHTQRASLLVGSSTDLRIVNRNASPKDRELFSLFREGWEVKNIEQARFELVSRAGKTMDSAIVGYLDNGHFGWRAMSYESGDTLYEHVNPLTGETAVFGRLYSMPSDDGEGTVQYLDVWDTTFYKRYKNNPDKTVATTGESTWEEDMKETPHGFDFCPVSYIRYGETFWGNAILPVDEMEKDLSQLLENNKIYGLRVLVALGSEMSVKASFDGRPLQINGPADGKVNYLEPADASNSFNLSIKSLEEQAYIAANCVKQTELHSGSDVSSLTVSMLNQPAYRKAILDTYKFQPAIDKLVRIFQYGWFLESKRASENASLHVKARTYPYVMRSETEEVANVTALKAAGALSAHSASEEGYNLGYGSVDEYERILQEQHDELVADQSTQAQRAGEAGGNTNNPVNAARQALAR